MQSANSLAREILLKQHADGHDGHRVPPAFAAPSRRPHLSLIYGDHPQEERSKIVSWIKELSLSHGGHGGVVTPSKQKHQKKQRCQRCWHANVQKWRVSCLGASGSYISTCIKKVHQFFLSQISYQSYCRWTKSCTWWYIEMHICIFAYISPIN